MREGSRQYFEEQWVQRPLKSLGFIACRCGHLAVRAQETRDGVLQLLRECAP